MHKVNDRIDLPENVQEGELSKAEGSTSPGWVYQFSFRPILDSTLAKVVSS
jgi:hypothetical protein